MDKRELDSAIYVINERLHNESSIISFIKRMRITSYITEVSIEVEDDPVTDYYSICGYKLVIRFVTFPMSVERLKNFNSINTF